MGLSGLLYYVEGPIHTFIRLICVVMFWLSALSLAYCWPDGKNRFRSCRLRIPAGMAVRDFLDLVSEERNNRIDHIRQHQGLGSPRQTISSRIHQENDTKAKATNAVLDLGGIVPTAVAVFGFGPLKDMKGVNGVVLWLCTFVLSLVAGLFAAWRKRYWNRLRNCQRILSEKAESTENVDKVVQAVPSHVIQ